MWSCGISPGLEDSRLERDSTAESAGHGANESRLLYFLRRWLGRRFALIAVLAAAAALSRWLLE
jgi:hypothetical protein